MYRRTEEFLTDWDYESKMTVKVLESLTDAALGQKVVPDGRTLGQIAWHVALTLGEMMGQAGLRFDGPSEDASVPSRAAEIRTVFERGAAAIAEQVGARWSEERLAEEIEMYGEKWTRGKTLAVLILHQTHHRGQMTVLMRQAGLRVPGVYGPAREEWAAYGRPAPW